MKIIDYFILSVGLLLVGGAYFFLPVIAREHYVNSSTFLTHDITLLTPEAATLSEAIPFVATHLDTPKPLKAIYMSSWVAGTTDFKNSLISLIDTTEANAVVIDIKDYTGRISYEVTDQVLKDMGSQEKRIPDIRGLIKLLHDKNIYVIGRIAVFQDAYMIKKHPEYAVKKNSDQTKVWGDHKGIGWIDAGAQPMWDYILAIAKDSHSQGFDEINFDYIRFPSDGNMKDIYYPVSQGKVKRDVMKSFFEYVHQNLADEHVITSADLFGMTVLNTDDLNIGQVLENALPNFDYICPMVYPSHFPKDWNGYANPATKPYEVIKYTMDKAVLRTEAMGEDKYKIRPWLQDFNLGAIYTAEMVRKQITGLTDAGLDSWMLWDAANTYTKGALLEE